MKIEPKFSEIIHPNINQFIGELYTATSKIDLVEYRHWALSQLQNLISFDGAIWTNGHQQTAKFHNQTLFNVPEELTKSLLKYLTINPMADVLLNQLGHPIDMQDLLNDVDFYRSQIYIKCFQPLGIERILASVHLDERTGVFTLLTLYRFNRQKPFTKHDKCIQQQALYHLLSAANHALFLQLEQNNQTLNCHRAICDKEGYLHQMQPSFWQIVTQHFPKCSLQKLPFTLPPPLQETVINGVKVKVKCFGDLFIIELAMPDIFDQLSNREQQVVKTIAKGMTFKLAAKELNLSPSTVSNHLYRIYQKLNIGSKSELLKLLP